MSTDDYSYNLIKEYMAFPGGHTNSIHVRVFWSLGDRTAATILQALYPLFRVDDSTIYKTLNAVRTSFENPNSIRVALDRIPAVTICLLQWLMWRAESEGHREAIEIVLDQIRQIKP